MSYKAITNLCAKQTACPGLKKRAAPLFAEPPGGLPQQPNPKYWQRVSQMELQSKPLKQNMNETSL